MTDTHICKLLKEAYLNSRGSPLLHSFSSRRLLYWKVPSRGCPCVTRALNRPRSIPVLFQGDSFGTRSAVVYRCASAAPKLQIYSRYKVGNSDRTSPTVIALFCMQGAGNCCQADFSWRDSCLTFLLEEA